MLACLGYDDLERFCIVAVQAHIGDLGIGPRDDRQISDMIKIDDLSRDLAVPLRPDQLLIRSQIALLDGDALVRVANPMSKL
jgi:hypothetical protein